MTTIEPGYRLARDGSSHWYVIPSDKVEEWSAWRDLPEDNPESWDPPEWATRVGGGAERVWFPEFTII